MPAVLIPVRVETRFTTVEVPDVADHLGDLIDSLSKLEAILERLRRRRYATTLVGNVKEKAIFKATVEEPLYKATETDLAAIGAQLEAMQDTARAADPHRHRRAAEAAREASCRRCAKASAPAGTALAALRSDFQRDQYTAHLEALDSAAAAALEGDRRPGHAGHHARRPSSACAPAHKQRASSAAPPPAGRCGPNC